MEGVLRLGAAGLFTVIVVVILYLIERKTNVREKLPGMAWQLIVGCVLGIVAICGTEFGIPINGATMNLRDAAPLCAGLIFGGPAGIIAGIIGGVERFFAVYWGAGAYTQIACTLGTIIAGLYGACLRKYMLENKKPSALYALLMGAVAEVIHLLLVFATNMNDVATAFKVVQICSPYMIPGVALTTMLAALVINLIAKEQLYVPKNKRKIVYEVQLWLLIAIIITFFLTNLFTTILQQEIVAENIEPELHKLISIYVTAFMEIAILAVLFFQIFFLIRVVVVKNIHEVNAKLARIASGNLNTTVDVTSNLEFSSLSHDINATVSTLKHYIDMAEKRIDQELEFARNIQESSLTHSFPENPVYDIYATMMPAKEVGGDFYDFCKVGDHKLMIVIADVSGKGIPAAMFMMRAKTLLRNLAIHGIDVATLMIKANEELCRNNEANMFVTAWMGIVDTQTGEIEYANAGHNPPVVFRHETNTLEFLKSKPGLVLAGMDGVMYKSGTIKLEKGDGILLYTDGVTEATDANNELFGEDRLLMATSSNADVATPKAICELVKAGIDKFVGDAPQFDDITMLAFKFKTADQVNNTLIVKPSQETIPTVAEYLETRLDELGIPMKLAMKVNVIADEIYSNIVFYSKALIAKITCDVEDGKLTIIFKDDGIKYNPLEKEDPDITLAAEDRDIGGLGIFIVKEMAEKVEYIRSASTNILTVIINLDDK